MLHSENHQLFSLLKTQQTDRKTYFLIKPLSLGPNINADTFWDKASWKMLHLLKLFPWIILNALFWDIVS